MEVAAGGGKDVTYTTKQRTLQVENSEADPLTACVPEQEETE